MGTWHGDALGRAVDRACRGEPGAATNLRRVAADMRAGVGRPLVDVVVQKSVASYDVRDAYAFAVINRMLSLGGLAWTYIPAGGEPRRDCEAEWFNDALGKLPSPWSATFHGGTADEDGWLGWDRPAGFYLNVGAGVARILLPPGRAPLEIGTTAASRSLLHVLHEGGLARWPYGATRLHLLVKTDVIPDSEFP